jgi:hypothetical protein
LYYETVKVYDPSCVNEMVKHEIIETTLQEFVKSKPILVWTDNTSSGYQDDSYEIQILHTINTHLHLYLNKFKASFLSIDNYDVSVS